MLRVFTAFSGYDSQCMALQRAGVEFDLVGWSEIDKYAIQAHNALYPEYSERNYGDIAIINWDNVPDFDLFTYSFPCTDISNAGRQSGLSEGSGTRSSLLWECRKAIEQKRPQYLLMENVKALASKKFLPFFLKWQSWLSEQGYTNFAQVMNAKDYGVPQNRERLFMVSILGDAWFTFPDKQRLAKRLRDVLEDNVDEKYFLSDKLVEWFERRNELAVNKGNGFRFEPTLGGGYAKAITTKAGNRQTDNYIIDMDSLILQRPRGFNKGNEHSIAPTVTSHDYASNNVLQIGNVVKQAGFTNPQRGRVCSANGVSPTITTMQGGGLEPKIATRTRLRKLTPRECLRLMDVSDIDIDTIQSAGISNSQQYKLAGNSIVVACMTEIFKKLFNNDTPTSTINKANSVANYTATHTKR